MTQAVKLLNDVEVRFHREPFRDTADTGQLAVSAAEHPPSGSDTVRPTRGASISQTPPPNDAPVGVEAREIDGQADALDGGPVPPVTPHAPGTLVPAWRQEQPRALIMVQASDSMLAQVLEPADGIGDRLDMLTGRGGPVGCSDSQPVILDQQGHEQIVEPCSRVKMRNAPGLHLGEPMQADQAQALEPHRESLADAVPIVGRGWTIADRQGERETVTGKLSLIDGVQEPAIRSGGLVRPAGAFAPFMLGLDGANGRCSSAAVAVQCEYRHGKPSTG